MRISQQDTSINIRRRETKHGTITRVSKSKTFFSPSKDSDHLDMSSVGKRMSKISNLIKKVGPDKVKTRLNEVNEKFESLNLNNIDVDEMSNEEIVDKLSQVQNVILELRPNSEVDLSNLEGKTDEELKDLLQGIVDRVNTAKEEFSIIKSVVSNIINSNDTNESQDISNLDNEEVLDDILSTLENEDNID